MHHGLLCERGVDLLTGDHTGCDSTLRLEDLAAQLAEGRLRPCRDCMRLAEQRGAELHSPEVTSYAMVPGATWLISRLGDTPERERLAARMEATRENNGMPDAVPPLPEVSGLHAESAAPH